MGRVRRLDFVVPCRSSSPGFVPLALPLTEPVSILAVVMGVLLLAPLLLARFRVPGLVGLILAGVVLGPHGAGVLVREGTFELLGTVGLLYLMFEAGLEIDLYQFWKYRSRSLGFGLLTFGIPFIIGGAVGYGVLGYGPAPAILIGSVFASHTLLAYPVASKLDLTRTNAVTTAVGATILTDTLALLVLAVIAASAEGRVTPVFFGVLALKLGALVSLTLVGLPRLGAWFLRTVADEGTTEYAFVLASVFVSALAAEVAGVEPIIGAFLAGLALNRLVPEGGALAARIRFVGEALFLPFFLLATGMLVDVGALIGDPHQYVVIGAMVGVIFVSKGLAAWVTRSLFRYSGAEAGLLFGLTVPQAAATLAAVLVGYRLGLFDEAVLNGTIAMVLLTCLVGPWATERFGRAVRLAEDAQPVASGAVPVPRLLVSLANPETAERLLDVAFTLREGRSESVIYPLTVVPGGADQAEQVARGERLLTKAVAHAATAGVAVTPLVRVDLNVPRALARAAVETRSTTLLLGWDGSAAAQRILFGSIPDRLLQESPAMVWIVKPADGLGTIPRLVVAVPPQADHEPGYGAAIRAIKRQARSIGARLLVLTPAPYAPAVREGIARRRPDLAFSVETMPTWKELIATLDVHLGPSDGLVVLSARQGSVSWRTSLDRLPRILATRFADRLLQIVYPAQIPADALLTSGFTSGERAVLATLTSDRIRLGLTAGPLPNLLAEILRSIERARRAAAVQALLATDPDTLPEPAPGVAFYHAHLPFVRRTTLFVGISTEGLQVPRAARPVHVMLVLLVPDSLPPSKYLAQAAVVARLIPTEETVEVVRACTTADDVREVLLRRLRAPDDAI